MIAPCTYTIESLLKYQSNAKAWRWRAYALDKMGRHYEANESYKRAMQLEHASPAPQSSLKEIQRYQL